MKRSVLGLLAAVAVAAGGCAPMRYSEYTGKQAWTTKAGTMAASGYAVPVYRGWPDKPYKVIGSIQFANPDAHWDDGDTSRAASLAKRHGADAILMRKGSEFGVTEIVGDEMDPFVAPKERQVSALAIKWKSASELAQEEGVTDQFMAALKAAHPMLKVRRELVVIIGEHLASSGKSLADPAGRSEAESILMEVLSTPTDARESKWLFKGTVRSSGLARSFTQNVSGVATLVRTGESVTIVSAPGGVELNFSGNAKDGRLTGNLGTTTGPTIFSGKAEGVLVSDKISLSSQAQTADGVVQSSFTFIR